MSTERNRPETGYVYGRILDVCLTKINVPGGRISRAVKAPVDLGGIGGISPDQARKL